MVCKKFKLTQSAGVRKVLREYEGHAWKGQGQGQLWSEKVTKK